MLKRTTLFLLFIFWVWIQHAKAQCEPSEQKLFKSANTFFTFDEIAFTKNGTLIAVGSANLGGLKTTLASFGNNNNSISWLKLYNIINIRLVSVAANDDMFLVGYSATENSRTTLMVLRLDPAGNIKWVRRYKDTFSPDSWLLDNVRPYSMLATSDDGVVLCGSKIYQLSNSNNYKYSSFILKLDANGDLKWSRQDSNNGHDEYYSVVEKNGALFLGGNTQTGSFSYGTITKINPSTGNLDFVKGYFIGDVRASFVRKLVPTSYGFLLSVQAYKTEIIKHGYYVLKITDDGNIIDQTQLSFNSGGLFNPYYEAAPTSDGGCLVWLNDKDNTVFLKEANLFKLDPQLAPQWKKNYPVPGSIPDAVIMKAWDQNGSFKALGTSTDPKLTTQTRFARLFNIKTNGELTGCVTKDKELDIKDSLQYSVSSISFANTYNLVFEAPFTTSATLTSATVTEELICNTACVMNDLLIEGDSVLCNQSETIIKVTRNGTCPVDIEWDADPTFADIIRINDTTIRVQVKINGTGKITARWNGPCTIIQKEINLYRSSTNKQLNLGPDTSICRGNQLILSINESWNSITWFNNSSGLETSVNNPGSYWVSVSDDGICSYSDTLRLLQVYDNPAINIGAKESICLPGPLLLNPGTFPKYEWQDGTTNNTFSAYTTGTYWVKVTDNNNCSSSDTVEIKSIVEPPSDFVSFKDSAICVGQQVLLSVKNIFNSYSWNNGSSINPDYLIKSPGQYVVEVVDVNGCGGKDTIVIADKRCQYQVFFPNAFVPKGVNRTFKPIFPGAVPEEYVLSIYNRYGEKVFESTNPFAAWDGTYNGNLQPSGTFVWYCRYMFPDKAIRQEKNFVILIQ